jgi:hypothetical protein
MDTLDKLELISDESLRTVITWTLNDLDNWSNTSDDADYPEATQPVAGFSAMLKEAVEYQIEKEFVIYEEKNNE